MADEEEPVQSPSNQSEDCDLDLAELAGLSPEEILNILQGTPGFNDDLIEELKANGTLSEFLEQITKGATECSGNEDSPLNPEGDPESPSPAVMEPPTLPDDIQCSEVEVVTEPPILPTIKTEPEPGTADPVVVPEKTVLTINTETPAAQVQTEQKSSPSGTDPVQMFVSKKETSSETPSPNEDSSKSKSRDHHEKKKKKAKHSRKLSSDSSESIKKHKSKKKHKEKDKEREKSEKKHKDVPREKVVNPLSSKLQAIFQKFQNKYQLKLATIIAVDISEIVLLKTHMVLRKEKVSKIEEIDKERRLSYHKEQGYTLAKFASTKDKYYKLDRRQSTSKPEKNHKKKDEEKKSKKNRKRVYCASDDSDSDNDKSKHKKPSNVKSEKDKDKKHKDKDKDNYTASGARIMHYERKLQREQERIRRPKMADTEPTANKREEKNSRNIGIHDSENSKKLSALLREAEKSKRLAANQYKIPKSRRPEDDLLPASHDITRGQPPVIKQDLRETFKGFRRDNSAFRMPNPNPTNPTNPFSAGPSPHGQFRFNRFNNPNPNQEHHRPYNKFNQYVKPENLPPRKATRLETYEDDNNEMIDLPGSDEDEEIENAPPPIKEVGFSEAARTAFKLLHRGSVFLPELKGNAPLSTTEATAHKCAWWFQTIDKENGPWLSPCVPELDDDKIPSDDGGGSEYSSFGNVSNPDNDECQSNEVSSSDQLANAQRANDPDLRDEFCGATLLSAKFRTSIDDTFQSLFEVRPGTNYERENLQAKCTICDELIIGKRHLSRHLRGEVHRENFKHISLSVMTRPGKDKPDTPGVDPSSKRGPDRDKSSKGRDSKDKEGNKSSKSGKQEKEGKKNGDKGGGGNSMSVTSSRSRVNVMDELVERVSRTGSEPTHVALHLAGPLPRVLAVEEPVDRVSRAGSGISLQSPPTPISVSSQREKRKSRSKSPGIRKRAPPRRRTRSRSPRRRYSRSKSRSPGYSRRPARSRSPRRAPNRSPSRRTPLDPVDEFLAKVARRSRSRSPYDKYRGKKNHRSRSRSPLVNRKKNSLFPEKLKLQAAGIWNSQLEQKWIMMEAEEAALIQTHQEYRKNLAVNPDSHPSYSNEWTTWWGLKYVEVEKSNLDPDTYNYAPEWKEQWAKVSDLLLRAELDAQIDAVRLKYGMDLASLQRLLLGMPAPVAAPIPGIDVPLAFPITPRCVDPPLAPVPVGPVVVNKAEIYSPFDEDFTARSMSLSSGGSRAQSQVDEKPKPKVAQAEPVASTSKPVTVQTIQNTWEIMTGQKISGSASDVGSARSIMSMDLDFDGNDIVQVLKLMSNMEDQLGILSQQVHIYSAKAEELESARAKQSFKLLEEKEFVILLFQCRDKFNKLMSSNILPRDIMKRLNLTVYKLNLILELDACQNLRHLVTPATESLAVPITTSPAVDNLMQMMTRNADGPGSSVSVGSAKKKDIGKYIAEGLKFVPQADKIRISSIITASLMSQHKMSLSEPALLSYMYEILGPVIKKHRPEISSAASTVSSHSNHSRVSQGSGNAREHVLNPLFQPTIFPGTALPDPLPPTQQGVEGRALPRYPVLECRAASPPPSAGRYIGLHVQSVPPMARPMGPGPGPSSAYRQSPARGTPEGRPAAREPSKSPRKENRKPVPKSNYKSGSKYIARGSSRSNSKARGSSGSNSKARGSSGSTSKSRASSSSTSNSRKDLGVAQEFWNSDVSSVSSISAFGNDEPETQSRPSLPNLQNKKTNRPESSGSHTGSITNKSHLRNQPKVRPEHNPDLLISDPESGEILSDDSLSSVSLTKSDSDGGNTEDNLQKLGRIREKISDKKRSTKRNSSDGATSHSSERDNLHSRRRRRSHKKANRSDKKNSRSHRRPSLSPEHIRLSLHKTKRSKSKSKDRVKSNLEKDHHRRSKSKRKHRSRSRSRGRERSRRTSTTSKSSKRSPTRPRNSRRTSFTVRRQESIVKADALLEKYRRKQVKIIRHEQKVKKPPKSNPMHHGLRLDRKEPTDIFAEADTLEVISSPSVSSVGTLTPDRCSDGNKPFPFIVTRAVSISEAESANEAEVELAEPEDGQGILVQEVQETVDSAPVDNDRTPLQDELGSDTEINFMEV